MNSVNKKILDKICSDEKFAIEFYDAISLKPFDTFFSQEYIDDMVINNEDELFFIAHKCKYVDLLEKMWIEEKAEITYQLMLMNDKKIAMKLCKFAMLSEDDKMLSLCFSLKKIFSILPNERVHVLKMEIIQHLIKISEKDVFPILINNNTLNVRDFIVFSKTFTDRNETIINILNQYNKIGTIDIAEKIKELESSFKKELDGFKIGKNIQFKNDMTSLTTLLKINQDDIILSSKDSDFLLRVSKYFNNSSLFSLVNKIRLGEIFIDKYKTEKILKERL